MRKMLYVAWHSSVFVKQAYFFKMDIFKNYVNLFLLCFGRWLYNGNVEGSHLNRSPKCERATV
jgi:hypothetical protein